MRLPIPAQYLAAIRQLGKALPIEHFCPVSAALDQGRSPGLSFFGEDDVQFDVRCLVASAQRILIPYKSIELFQKHVGFPLPRALSSYANRLQWMGRLELPAKS